MDTRITLKEAIKFHGHLGPYLVLGILAGESALKKLKCKKYFGLKVKVYGAGKKPESCLVDGVQLSTGATYGKGNIRKFNGGKIQVLICNPETDRKIKISLKEDLIKRLDALKGHNDSEAFAKKLCRMNPSRLFEVKLTS